MVRNALKKSLQGPVKIKLKKQNVLGQYGYKTTNSERSRRIALGKAVRGHGKLPTFRRLVVLAIYTKNTNPRRSKLYRADAAWVMRQKGGAKN